MEGKKMKKTDGDKNLKAVFELLKKRDGIIIADQKTHFNDTELRLIGEVLSVKYAGKRIISTQLANRLGVTRSAISQTVNRLEAAGVVKRVADEVDRKIAYIEVTDETLSAYEEDIKECRAFVNGIVEQFGEEKFDTMCEMLQEFMGLIEEQRGKSRPIKRQKKYE